MEQIEEATVPSPRLPAPNAQSASPTFFGRNRFGLIAITLIVAIHGAFMVLDRRPFSYDDAWYADTSVRFLDAWAEGGLPGAYSFFTERTFMGNKAPLIILIPQPFLLIFGRQDFVFPLTNLFCAIVASIYVAKLTRRVGGRQTGGVAILAFCLMPLAINMTRLFFVEMLLTAIVLMFVYHAIQCEYFSRRSHSLMVGLTFGLGMLTKVTFPAFVGGLIVWLWIGTARRHKSHDLCLAPIVLAAIGPALSAVSFLENVDWLGDKTRQLLSAIHELLGPVELEGLVLTALALIFVWRGRSAWRLNLAMACCVGLWVSHIWYLPNGDTALNFAYSNSIGEISKNYGAASIFEATDDFRAHLTRVLEATGAYWIQNVNRGFGVIFAAAFVAIIPVLACVSIVRRRKHPGGSGPSVWLLVLMWTIPALIVFSLGRNRTTRFLLPLLPGFVVLYAVMMQSLADRARRAAQLLGGAHILAGLGAFIILSFGGPTVRVGPRDQYVVCGVELSERGIFSRDSFPLDRIVASAVKLAPRIENRPAEVTFLTDTIHVNQNTLLYAGAKARAPLVFGLLPYGPSLTESLKSLDRADLLVFQEGGKDFPDFTNENGRAALQALRSGEITGWEFPPEPAIQLPDGGVVRFATRMETVETKESGLTPCSVAFGDNAYELVGFQIECRESLFSLTTSWQRQGEDFGLYAIAAHLINADRSYAVNMDHGPRDGPGNFASLPIGETLLVSKTAALDELERPVKFLALALFETVSKRNQPLIVNDPAGAIQDGDWLLIPLPPNMPEPVVDKGTDGSSG